MIDRVTKTLLTVIATALSVIALHPAITPSVAQTPPMAPMQTQPVMAAGNSIVYVFQSGKLSAYLLDNKQIDTSAPEARAQKLRLLDTVNVQAGH